MGIFNLEADTMFQAALNKAKDAETKRAEAQKILDQATIIENEAVQAFRNWRSQKLAELQQKKQELEAQEEALEKEYRDLKRSFCAKRGKHETVTRTVRTGHKPLYHSFHRGNVYPTETYYTCLICGQSNDPRRFRDMYVDNTEKKVDKAIQEAAHSQENPELAKIAQAILDFPKKEKQLEGERKKLQKEFEEICRLFGHNAEMSSPYSESFDCKCCGKHMRYQEYIDAHYKARYGGGIVPFHYQDDNPIL